ncbi:MAG TPA: maleylpyruvate isomerase N-terminal domain-containing protein [Candidatus Saccharimonadales bacterium]|nr:maleylpyruvate isomerase N-terminal domain-containing protein [Candidatus Saccharimonadales bacterium]
MASGNITTAEGFRAAHAEIFSDVGTLAESLDDERAMLPTGCPGWTVRDHVAHIADLESILIGRPRAEHVVPEGLPYIRNQPGAFMEIGVDARRAVPMPDLLAEYRDVTTGRMARLATLEDAQLDQMGRGFFGESRVRSLLAIRVFDLWSHEQDMRRALRRPGGLDGVPAAHSRERMLMSAGNALQERLGPPAGTSIVFDVTGPGGALRSITFTGTRGLAGAAITESPSSRLRLDLPTLTVLTCGRADDPGARSRVVIEGDQNLGRLVLEDLAVTP